MNSSLDRRLRPVIGVMLWALCIVYIYPILLVLLSSLKSKHDLAVNPIGWPKEWTAANFQHAFHTMKYTQSLLNTILIAVISVAGVVLMGAAASYAIGRKRHRFYRFMYYLFMAGLIVPFQMTMIPLYKTLLALHFIGTYHGVIFIYFATMAPFSVFLLSGFVRTVPMELEEAASIDGCGIYGIFFRIVLPLLMPSLTTLAVLNTFNVWNDFLLPMLYLGSGDKMTITVQLASFQGRYANDWSSIFAGVCMIVLPMLIVYLLAQRFIISGITAGAVKG